MKHSTDEAIQIVDKFLALNKQLREGIKTNKE